MSSGKPPEAGPELSVVAPLHNEEENAAPLFHAIREALDPLGRSFEVLLVNDGSSDRTGEILDGLADSDPRLRPVHLDGNFGEAAALCAGFQEARGSVILTLDGDLQNDPADLPRLLRLLEEGGYRAVSGWRRDRQEEFTTRVLPSVAANWLIAKVTGLPSRDNGCGLKAYRAEVVEGTYLPHGLHRFMPAVFGVREGEFAQIEVVDRRRRAGRSHYGMGRFFAVVRDLLAIPYLLTDPDRGLRCMNRLVLCGALLGWASILLAARRRWLAVSLGSSALLVLSYGICVRANLLRWLEAQESGTFRLRPPEV